MKHNITKSLLALVISLLALPMQSQDYLKIYFKDGHTERHYMHLVESISATKYDLEGNLHSDYQMQQIVMKDATYSYYLADIDSMSFKKVYEEQVKADVEQVSNTITPIFEQCATIEEMETHIDEMKAMDCVEDVWREGSDIVVQIRDWKKIFYKYPLVSDSDFSQILNSSTRNSENLLPIKSDGTPMKVGIAFQMVDDPRFDDEERALFILSNRFQQLGFDSHYIDVLDFDFFNKDIFNYDILFLATHGSYSKGKHYLYTSIKTDLKDDLLWEIANRELGSVGIDYDDISYSYCQTGEYLINFGTFIVISEDYIRRSQYNFTGPGPHVVFNAACSSLKGGNQLTRENDSETFRGNDSMAKVFFNKGADVYFGETNDSYNSRLAGLNLFYYMLDGASEECAYNQLDPDYKYESDSNDKSALIDLFNPNSKYDIKGLFLNSVQTEEKSVKEINDEYKTNGQIELKGKISPLLDINQGLTFGFRLSSEPDVDTSNEYETIKSTNADYSGRDFGEVTFSAVVDPEPGKTYYYRAYTYDGNNYNYGSPYSFTIENDAIVDVETILSMIRPLVVTVEGGSFTMGATDGWGYDDERPTHEVNLSTFKICSHEVTQKLWVAIMGSNPSTTIGDNLPVNNLSWDECQTFIERLNALVSEESGITFRLPTEAEWEYAARGGKSRNDLETNKSNGYQYAGGYNSIKDMEPYVWCSDNSDGSIHPVGTKKPNELGLYDMSGNVCEYVQDYLTDNYTEEIQTNPKGALTGVYRVFRGGSYERPKWQCRLASRFGSKPDEQSSECGLRLVLTDSNSSEDPIVYTSCPNNNHPHAIDLGLPSGTLWACCNVGASKPDDYGGYYAWGEVEEKDCYNFSTYTHCDGSVSTIHDIGSDISDTGYDVAHIKWGGEWAMPNNRQIDELYKYCTLDNTAHIGVNGLKFTGPNDHYIFLPASGEYMDSSIRRGEECVYWSSQLSIMVPETAYYWGTSTIDKGRVSKSHSRCVGKTVRPVYKKKQ